MARVGKTPSSGSPLVTNTLPAVTSRLSVTTESTSPAISVGWRLKRFPFSRHYVQGGTFHAKAPRHHHRPRHHHHRRSSDLQPYQEPASGTRNPEGPGPSGRHGARKPARGRSGLLRRHGLRPPEEY